VVWAEVTAAFPSAAAAERALEQLGVTFSALGAPAAQAAGAAWFAYRRAGATRDRVMADFLIGAHASGAADRLLTRDRGFYRRYFEGLTVLDPSRT
jgi:predicted nucleic acid-binding protein